MSFSTTDKGIHCSLALGRGYVLENGMNCKSAHSEPNFIWLLHQKKNHVWGNEAGRR